MPNKPIRASEKPIPMEVEKGKMYFWCACGKSAWQPICDSSHNKDDLLPVVFEAEETKTVYLCGCKATGNPPFCDGSHQFEQGGDRYKYYMGTDA